MLSVGHLSAQDLILDNGIYYEVPQLKDTTKHKYSLDNISYRLNSVLTFDYYYLDKDGCKKKFLRSSNESSKTNPLNLVDYESEVDSVINKIVMYIDDNNEMFFQFDSSYTQTTFKYFYICKDSNLSDTLKKELQIMELESEETGIVDNRKNLWLHPPRSYSFRILQLNPFPFYSLDERNNTWSWTLETGGSYLDSRWIDNQTNIKINYNYKRLPDETIDTPLGKLKCKVTKATGLAKLKSGTLKTSLKSYYFPSLGFVRLEYININKTILVLQLTDVK